MIKIIKWLIIFTIVVVLCGTALLIAGIIRLPQPEEKDKPETDIVSAATGHGDGATPDLPPGAEPPATTAQWVPWVQPTWDETMTNEHGTITMCAGNIPNGIWDMFDTTRSDGATGNLGGGSRQLTLTLNYSIRVSSITIVTAGHDMILALDMYCQDTQQFMDDVVWLRTGSFHNIAQHIPHIKTNIMRFRFTDRLGHKVIPRVAITAERLVEPEPVTHTVAGTPTLAEGVLETRLADGSWGQTQLTIEDGATIEIRFTRANGFVGEPVLFRSPNRGTIGERTETALGQWTWTLTNVTGNIIAWGIGTGVVPCDGCCDDDDPDPGDGNDYDDCDPGDCDDYDNGGGYPYEPCDEPEDEESSRHWLTRAWNWCYNTFFNTPLRITLFAFGMLVKVLMWVAVILIARRST